MNSTLLPLEVGLCIHSLACGPHHLSIYHWPKPTLKSEHMKFKNQQRVTASTHTPSQAVLTLPPQYPRKMGLWLLGKHTLRAPPRNRVHFQAALIVRKFFLLIIGHHFPLVVIDPDRSL